MNQITIQGYAGADAELKTTKTGKPWAKVSLGVTKKTGDMQKTSWFNVVAFNRAAEVLSKIKKGDGAIISGQMEQTEWTDKSGQARKDWQLTAWNCGIVPKTQVSRTSDTADVPDYNENDAIPF